MLNRKPKKFQRNAKDIKEQIFAEKNVIEGPFLRIYNNFSTFLQSGLQTSFSQLFYCLYEFFYISAGICFLFQIPSDSFEYLFFQMPISQRANIFALTILDFKLCILLLIKTINTHNICGMRSKVALIKTIKTHNICGMRSKVAIVAKELHGFNLVKFDCP